MAFKMIEEDEPIEVGALVVVIFGFPGTGKTSLAFQSDNPVMVDFEDGVKRAVRRKRYLKLESWEDLAAYVNSPEFTNNKPKTLIIDTGGSMLDNYLAKWLIKQNDKNSNKMGGLSLQGYGVMKTNFDSFVDDMKRKAVDLVFVCHADTYQDGETNKFKPKMTGGSYDILMANADLVGFMEIESGRRKLNFNPTERHTGKNCAGYEPFIVPHAHEQPQLYENFLGGIIKNTRDHMLRKSEMQVEHEKKQTKFLQEVELCATLEELDMLRPAISELPPVIGNAVLRELNEKYITLYKERVASVQTPVQADEAVQLTKPFLESDDRKLAVRMQSLLKERTDQLGYVYKTETKRFHDPKATETAPAVAESPAASLFDEKDEK